MRVFLRALLILVVIVGVGFLLVGYWAGSSWSARGERHDTVGTSGTVVDTEKARERGAEIGEKSAIAAQKVKSEIDEATLTGKIKAKMALDDSVKARAIDVTTDSGVVTLSGTVRSSAEHDRALALARETNGVSSVVDHLVVR